jgi:hypothetical protein
MKSLLGMIIIGFTLVWAILLAGGSLTLRFNWPTVVVWTVLIPVIAGLGVWYLLSIIDGQAREITRLRREVKMLEQVIDAELERTAPSSSHVEDRAGMPSYHP